MAEITEQEGRNLVRSDTGIVDAPPADATSEAFEPQVHDEYINIDLRDRGRRAPAGPAPAPHEAEPRKAPLQQPPDSRVVKKLVVFSDGTGNSSAKAEKTNVWRMFQALDQTTPEQLALYDDGVGTSTNKYLALLGGAFGWGLKQNVIDLYKFVCRNYVDEETKIYGFGFSRGAFTIRMLTGLIAAEGLVEFSSERELDQLAHQIYNKFRRDCMKPKPASPVYVYRAASKLLARLARPWRSHARQFRTRMDVKIEFLGLWDTVGAYGMPVAELKPAVQWLFWPMDFLDCKLSGIVQRACHALSLDDQRTTFHPILWDESTETNPHRISQVWFAGVHANVGGGYPEDQLSLVALDWMMQEAMKAGLRLQQHCVGRVSAEKSAFARIYDSRDAVAAFYRYSPRTIETGAHTKAGPVIPVVHWSVIARMAHGSDAYVPNSLPPRFLVLAPNGELLPMEGFPQEETDRRIAVAAPNTPQVLDTDLADERTAAVKQAMAGLTKPIAATTEPIFNTVWLRRLAYVASATFATAIALFPWLADALHSLLPARVAERDPAFGGLLSALVGSAVDVLPSLLAPWASTILAYPIEAGAIGFAFIASFREGTLLAQQLRDFGLLAWHAQIHTPFRNALAKVESVRAKRTAALLLLFDAIWAVLFLAPGTRHLAAAALWPALGLNLLALARIGWHRRYISILKDNQKPVCSGHLGQMIARACRTSPALKISGKFFRERCLPFLFGCALVYGMAVIANRVLFNVESASGAFCSGSANGTPLQAANSLLTVNREFATGQLCWASGVQLERGTRYHIVLDNSGQPWRDLNTPAGMEGFKANSIAHAIATPLKHWWSAPWFRPIARVGPKGSEEFELTPCEPRAAAGNLLVAEITPQTSGELFLFVNDVVIAWPGPTSYFYDNNKGGAKVSIEPVRPDGQSQYAAYCK